MGRRGARGASAAPRDRQGLGACEGECEVDTGRRIGADVIASGGSVDALDDAATKAAAEPVDPLR